MRPVSVELRGHRPDAGLPVTHKEPLMDLDSTVLLICAGFLLFAIVVGIIGKRMNDDQN